MLFLFRMVKGAYFIIPMGLIFDCVTRVCSDMVWVGQYSDKLQYKCVVLCSFAIFNKNDNGHNNSSLYIYEYILLPTLIGIHYITLQYS